jgi:hypothetical protein
MRSDGRPTGGKGAIQQLMRSWLPSGSVGWSKGRTPMADTKAKRLYVHSDRSSWVVVTETEDGFLYEFGDGDRLLFGDLPHGSWHLMVKIQEDSDG